MVRKATKQDITRMAEIIIFGKRVAYRSIFQNDEVSFNEMQVVPLWEEYNNHPEQIENMLVFDDGIVKGVINCKSIGDEAEICEFYEANGFHANGKTCLVEGTDKVDLCYEYNINI